METLPALLAAAGVVFASLIALIGVMLGHLYARVAKLEGKVQQERDYNNLMWEWARHMLDTYLQWRRAGAPDPRPIPKRSPDDEN